MPEKKKVRKGGGVEERLFRHYKSQKCGYTLEFVVTRRCGWMNDCRGTYHGDRAAGFFPHHHGRYKVKSENSDWLTLARVHKMSVREVKDIISKRRGWTPDVREQVVFD